MRILIVEDELKTLSYLSKGLSEAGYEIFTAADGDSGLELAMRSDFDLLILDVMLPKREGWSIIEELRKAGRQALTLFLTARDGLDDRIKGLDLGADAYLVKPFAFSELLAHVRSLLRRRSGTASDSPAHRSESGVASGSERVLQTQDDHQFHVETVIEIDDLKIDRIAHQATRSGRGRVIDLTPKEFSLLVLLASRRGEVLSRALISEIIWNIHFDSGTNSVEVHIRRLRAKVDDPWEKKLIKTVRGSGYTIEVPISRD